MRDAVVIEKAGGNYAPDLPGCIATNDMVRAVEAEIREAIRFHVANRGGMRHGALCRL
jgi:predicted RNase H-like HicB family nuclease